EIIRELTETKRINNSHQIWLLREMDLYSLCLGVLLVQIDDLLNQLSHFCRARHQLYFTRYKSFRVQELVDHVQRLIAGRSANSKHAVTPGVPALFHLHQIVYRRQYGRHRATKIMCSDSQDLVLKFIKTLKLLV